MSNNKLETSRIVKNQNSYLFNILYQRIVDSLVRINLLID